MGTNQFPNPPTITGMTKKKIMIKACAVTITLYNWWFPKRKPLEGEESSKRIRTLSRVPQTPERAPKRKYSVPISLWFVEKNHRRTKATTLLLLVEELSLIEVATVACNFAKVLLIGENSIFIIRSKQNTPLAIREFIL